MSNDIAASAAVWLRSQNATWGAATGANRIALFTNLAAQARTSGYFWGAQWEENARFASSYIRTSNAQVTRPADVQTYLSGEVPAAMFATRGQFDQLSPEFAASDLVSGEEYWLLSFGGSYNGIRIRHNGTDVRVESVESGTVRAESQALAHSRDALLGALEWRPDTGHVLVGGVSGAAGTPWSWASAGVRVGGVHGAANEAFCRFGALRSA